MFDPFGDFESAGYLRNIERLKNPEEIKIQEHAFFEANLENALLFLERTRGEIGYRHFLEVHRVLFEEFYPWAGRDRHMLGVGRLVGKGPRVKQFEVSELCQQAVQWGLRMGNDLDTMRRSPGAVMGAFAWGHPFLDGNGRTMLVVHSVLSHRAGMLIDWSATHKQDYLSALTEELNDPRGQHLDAYLQPFIRKSVRNSSLLDHLLELPGLDGLDRERDDNIAYAENDPQAIHNYLEMKRSRGETY